MVDLSERFHELSDDDWSRIGAIFLKYLNYRDRDGQGCLEFAGVVQDYLDGRYVRKEKGRPYSIDTELAGIIAMGAIISYRRFVEEAISNERAQEKAAVYAIADAQAEVEHGIS